MDREKPFYHDTYPIKLNQVIAADKESNTNQ